MKGNLHKNRFIEIKNNQHANDWKNFVNTNLDFQEPSNKTKFFWSKWFYIFSWLLLILPGIIMTLIRKKKIKKLKEHFLEKRFNFFKTWFSVNFEDLDVVGRPHIGYFQQIARKHRGIGIPGDANIHEWSNGYAFKYQKDMIINSASIVWHWQRSNGKNTQHYYRRKIYLWIPNVAIKWTNFEFQLKRDNLFTKKTGTLENETFNKKWIYPNNDPIKIRRLLTPATQESILEKIGAFKNGKTFCFLKKKEDFLFSMTIDLKNNPFKIDIPVSIDLSKKENISKAIYEDVINDVDQTQKMLKVLAIFYRLL